MKHILFFCFLLIVFLFGALIVYFGLNTPDPLDYFYTYSGYVGIFFVFCAILLTRFKKAKWARRFGLAGAFYILLHFLNFIVLDKDFDWVDIYGELKKNSFIWFGIVGFLGFLFACLLSFKKTQRYKKLRSTFVYIGALSGSIHILYSVKVAEFLQWSVLVLCVLLCFARLLPKKRYRSNA